MAIHVPADLGGLGGGQLQGYIDQINDQIPKSRREKDELEKLAQMYKKDPEAREKALGEAQAVAGEIEVMEADHRRLTEALKAQGAPAPAPAGDTGVVRARALYAFEAERDEELSLKEGDIVTVLDREDLDGWWEGELHGVTGFFPAQYTELI